MDNPINMPLDQAVKILQDRDNRVEATPWDRAVLAIITDLQLRVRTLEGHDMGTPGCGGEE